MILTKDIQYGRDGSKSQGFLAYDDQYQQPRPCVMIAHDWAGRGHAVCEKAIQLASMGYIGFAIDMYGEAKLGQNNEQRRALMTPLVENRTLLADRMLAALNTVCSLPQVNNEKVAVLGYCFGGLCALDLARTGAAIKGAISFHGLLSEPPSPSSETIKAKILVLHGYDDPLVPYDQVTDFTAEMSLKQVDWQIHIYGLTAHSFTNPEANDASMGLHYNKSADVRSWASTTLFLEEVFSTDTVR
jgi:dienelactone hydrolase